MPLTTIVGDLICMAKGREFDIIVHECNCENVQEPFIGKSLFVAFPEALQADHTFRNDGKKMVPGSYSIGAVLRDDGSELLIVNAYTKHFYSITQGDHLQRKEAISCVFKQLGTEFKGKRVGMPFLGTIWVDIKPIIAKAMAECRAFVVSHVQHPQDSKRCLDCTHITKIKDLKNGRCCHCVNERQLWKQAKVPYRSRKHCWLCKRLLKRHERGADYHVECKAYIARKRW